MNIYKHELKAYWKSTVLWICALSGIMAIMMLFYPTIKSDIDTFMRILDNYPPAMKAAFGIVAESFTSPIGYYSFPFTEAVLFGAIQAMNLGVGIVSKEERELTADFLMTKPVSRSKILTAKLLSALTLLLITNVIYTVITASLIGALSEGNFDTGKFALINASLFYTQLVFFSLGLIVSIALKKIKSVLPVSLGIVFMFFAISAFAVTSESDKLRYITPFQYFRVSYILKETGYESSFAITGALIFIVCISLSYILYKRKDIHSV